MKKLLLPLLMLIAINSFSQLTYEARISKLKKNGTTYDESRTNNNLRLVSYELDKGIMLSEAFFENGKPVMCLTTSRDLKEVTELRNLDIYLIKNPQLKFINLEMSISGYNINNYFCKVSEILQNKDLFYYLIKYE
jgi:hypothetical protein